MRRDRWNVVTTWKFVVFSIAIILFFCLLLGDGDGFILLLDHANLLFHEAGHVIFGFFGSTLGLYGGTIGQLVFPVVIAVYFWREAKPVGCAVCVVWFFQNFLNIAWYMADARAQLLPLVGSGEHDWTDILFRWGVLASDTKIAAFVNALGWLGMLGAWLWLCWRWYSGSAVRRSA